MVTDKGLQVCVLSLVCVVECRLPCLEAQTLLKQLLDLLVFPCFSKLAFSSLCYLSLSSFLMTVFLHGKDEVEVLEDDELNT